MSYIITDDQITVFAADGPVTAMRSHISPTTWADILEAINDGDYDEAAGLLTPRRTLENFFDGSAHIVNGEVVRNGRAVDTYAARRALQFAHEGLPVTPILAFIDRVAENPSYRAVQDLYAFLEASQMPLDDDGFFLAYKRVRRHSDGNLVDIFTGEIPNDPGCIVEMPRNEVDEDPDRPCSHGLHVCSHDYLPEFGANPGNVVIAVCVDPADVVAVPRDYNNAKMRVCRYESLRVLKEYDGGNPLAGHYVAPEPKTTTS